RPRLVLLSCPTRRSSDLREQLSHIVCRLAINTDDAVAGHDALRRDFDTREAGLVRCRTRGNTQHEHALASRQRKQALIELFVHRSEEHTSELQSRENLVC